ncbi:hypothetical protein D3P07_00675 [Paenibacillus sp. 1011MAR3C5]|uniref:hypothetical protein n=1 Tax=Paenibacillus sp. 1011MAR3C5 TaxID=1675787 RepID=UPI000E6B634A|nr:hypothetical protein [Paenibacillus sp. 1011MAR3C5]RJE90658.1 hypothetical protein D3P07_00675 [Paenibacillus sp. 1011MAR3C5]
MATVGQQLPIPEVGWKRIDDINPSIKYAGTGWTSVARDPNTYAGTGTYTTLSGATNNSIRFSFYGTKIRIIDLYWTNRVINVNISIDGIISSWNPNNSINLYKMLVFESLNLPLATHEVVITTNSTSGIFSIDAIDIDSDGRLIHPDEVFKLNDLTVGKRIRCNYKASSNAVGSFSGIGVETKDFIPVASSATPDGDFYFIMVEDWNRRKRLIADRNIQHSISWDTLNMFGLTTGNRVEITLDDGTRVDPNIRLLTGGTTATDKDNEWDKYIVNSTLNNTIIAGDNNVWNWNVGITSWTTTTPANNPSLRVRRGYNSSVNTWLGDAPSSGGNYLSYSAFRPMMIIEIPLSYTLFYNNGEYKRWIEGNKEVKSSYTDDLVPKMISNNSPYGVVRASSTYASVSPYLAFDDSNTTEASAWITNATKAGWLEYEFISPKIITKYTLASQKFSGGSTVSELFARAPKSWTFEGSNDGVMWDILDTQTNVSVWRDGVKSEFAITNTQSYLKYRINITENNGSTFTAIGEFEMLGTIPAVPATPSYWKTVSRTLPSVDTFISDGMDSYLSSLVRKIKKTEQTMTGGSALGSGKMFRSTIDLKKWIDIRGIKVK